ncbi:MAG: CASTOR/POLLUX-related putative ion channel [Verrucomicrobiia bacterium]
MKNLYSRWRRFVDLVSYRLDNFFIRGISAQTILMCALLVGLILLGTLSLPLGMYEPRNKDVPSIGHQFGEGFWDAAWWSTMHIFDASYVSQDYGANPSIVVLGLVISLLGLILFGGVVGLVSAGVMSRLEKLAEGRSPIHESGHILILGWNDKIFSILDLFEDHHKTVTIVILSGHTISTMQDQMRSERGRTRRIQPILRSGSPTNLSELERMSFRDAYSIIVLADESNANPDGKDIGTIKTLMLLAGNVPKVAPRPKMVAEIDRPENLDVAGIASQRSVSLVCPSQILSRMIVQATRQPGLSHVYSSLLSFVGNEIFIQPQPGCTGRRLGESMFDFPNAILLGTSSMEERDGHPYFRHHINPGKDRMVGKSEWLILLARGCVVYQPKANTTFDSEVLPPEPRSFPQGSILILGWNDRIFNILQEYDSFLGVGSHITIASLHPPHEASAWLEEKLSRPLVNVTPTCVQTDYTHVAKLDALLSGTFDTCIILADVSSGGCDPDARAIATMLLLRDYERRHPDRRLKQVVVEVLSAANSELLNQHCQTDIVISPRLISMLLAQISQQLMLERVYADLMNAHANEIYLKPVTHYSGDPGACTFAELMRSAARRGELAIGVKFHARANDAASEFGVRINPPKNELLGLGLEDQVIVISKQGGELIA